MSHCVVYDHQEVLNLRELYQVAFLRSLLVEEVVLHTVYVIKHDSVSLDGHDMEV